MVLSPAQWNLGISMIELTGNGSEEARFFRGVQRWREKWRVPRYVYLTQLDHRLLLDLDHPLAIAELHEMLKKAGEHDLLKLQEMLPDFEHLWLKDSDNRSYMAELVVPVILRAEALRYIHGTMSSAFPKKYPPRPISDQERRQPPGTDWIFLKLYTPFKQHDEIITRALPTIVSEMEQQQLIDRWFFMRYADPEPHLRVRFHTASEETRQSVLIKALSWSQVLVQQRMIGKVVVDTYDREIERYGGPQAIDAIESVFMVNSASLCQIVAASYTKEITLDPLAVAVFTLDQFFEMWGLDFSARLKYLQERTEKYGFSDAFRAHRRLFCELLMPRNAHDDLFIKAQREQLWHICQAQRPVLEVVSSCIRVLAERGELWQTEETILGSLAHMHINRLLGINREREEMIYAFWRHTLESLQRQMNQGVLLI
jgi:thiopeptide-type bacteriocin biosynthesis protein